MKKKRNRRNFLKEFLLLGGGAAAVVAGLLKNPAARRLSFSTDVISTDDISANVISAADKVFLPCVLQNEPSLPGLGRVVHAHANEAVNWDLTRLDYWNYVNQDVVDRMVDQGVMSLTRKAQLSDAWRSLLTQGYYRGDKIAVKVSFNNCPFSDDRCRNPMTGYIDGIKEPINAIIRGLKLAGVVEEDIWVYETTRNLPTRFYEPIKERYPNVQFYDWSCNNDNAAYNWDCTEEEHNAYVEFTPPDGVLKPNNLRLCDVVCLAKYLINVPIMKKHANAGISLGFKNHIGTVGNPVDIHDWIFPSENLADPYRSTYSPLVEIYRNPNIGKKTILTVGDGLFAAFSHDKAPKPWGTFGNNVPKSLFFGTDPVAVDSVMADFLYTELGVFDNDYKSSQYLRLAEEAGLGIYEQGNPWTNSYNKIDYQKIEFS